MAHGIEETIEKYMKIEAGNGHFENTFNEIKASIDQVFSRGTVLEALVRMEGKQIISTRMKGKTKLYYLTELRKMSQKIR